MINTIIRLRRDNDYNYQKIANSFIPQNGEICLVDTAREGLRAVCGDGVTPFGQLEYLNDIVQYGYYIKDTFCKDAEGTQSFQGNRTKLYIDIISRIMYFFDGENFKEITFKLPTANEEEAGIVKLYDSMGYNIDGTMTQRAITEELNEKFELLIKEEDEMVIFAQDLF